MLHRRNPRTAGTLDELEMPDPLALCLLHCLRASPSGWSSADDLVHDLERFFGLAVPAATIRRGMWELSVEGRIDTVLDDACIVWHRVRAD